MRDSISYEPADIIIHVQGKGIVLREKSILAFQKSDGKILAFGTEAEYLAGKDSDDIVVMSPLRRGMVADFSVASKLFSLLVKKALGKRPIRKQAMAVCVPGGMTEVEKKAIEDALFYGGGASEVFISDIPAEEFIREFPEKFPREYRKFKITIGITKEEPERYVAEQLREAFDYAGQEQIPPERVCGLLQELEEARREHK